MGFQVVKVTDPKDFDEIAFVENDSFRRPYQTFVEFLIPIENPEDEDQYKAGVDALAERLRSVFLKDKTVTWIKVVDDDTGKILGASKWVVFDRDACAAPKHKVECTWWKEGLGREVANHYLAQLLSREKYMQEPHFYLNTFITSPDARRKGIGNLMMEWGNREADRLGYPSFVEASLVGSYLYRKHGYIEGPVGHLSITGFEESEELEQLKQKFLPYSFRPMYRPVRGIYDPETTVLPWSNT